MVNAADYTGMGENYRKYRIGYSESVITQLIKHTGILKKNGQVVDVGAGTGIWTRQLAEKGIKCIAVEPNPSMSKEGKKYTQDLNNITWVDGNAEVTNLEDNCADWVTMASAFHWTDERRSLPEFHRILKEEGYITLIWNPLVKKGDPIQEAVESLIKKEVPEFKRIRAEINYSQLLEQSGYFKDVYEVKEVNIIERPLEQYLAAWNAVTDLKAQAGEERFARVITGITKIVKELSHEREEIAVPYLTRSWTAKKINGGKHT